MHLPIEFAAADREFYAPLENLRSDAEALRPGTVPRGWSSIESGVWTQWQRPGHSDLVDDGWKVHVSARPGRLQHVLDRAAEICFAEKVPFKHLSTPVLYWWMHQKYAPRSQSGKFVAAYPRDVEAARRLMDALRAALAEEDGPYVLSDRRFKDSRTVHYRYGSFVRRFRPQADGILSPLTLDGGGRLVPDRRGVSFQLPEGVVDPFVEPRPAPARATEFGGFAIESSIQFTNAGGTYRGREVATGRQVFIKEARCHTGLRDDGVTAPEALREEWETLKALHALAPGLAPEPISYFRVWEHEFLVAEHVNGLILGKWVARNHPMLRAGAAEDDFVPFYDRCAEVISAVEAALRRLHELGYVFVDISPSNVILGDDDSVRLIDFGSTHRLGGTFLRAGTPGYAPPEDLVGDDLTIYDDYGLSALAQHFFGPLHPVRDISPDVLAHLHYDLNELAPVPPALWKRATKYHPPTDSPQLPAPEQVAADPIRHLTDLRDRVADGLIAMADVDHPVRVFPTIPEGYASNAVGIAYGTAGVVHALCRAGRSLPDGLLDRLRRDALDKVGDLPPGLYSGTAGVAWVLADRGLVDEAVDLLAAADRHPLTSECATLFGGAAGVALTHLALYGHTRDERHVDRALALAAALPPDDLLTAKLGPDDAVGLMHGRCGVALMLQQLAGVTGDERHLIRAVRLLHAELDRTSDPDAPGLVFPVSSTDRRAMPYLFAGSAGMLYATTRCVRAADDERLAQALPRLAAALRLTYTVMSGLCQGFGGLVFALADHAALTGNEASREWALRGARSVFKYALPHRTGVRFLGDQMLRYSAELWSGSAGNLLALAHVLDPRPGALFTVDAPIRERRSAAELVSADVPAAVR
jgi:hypothetical protein